MKTQAMRAGMVAALLLVCTACAPRGGAEDMRIDAGRKAPEAISRAAAPGVNAEWTETASPTAPNADAQPIETPTFRLGAPIAAKPATKHHEEILPEVGESIGYPDRAKLLTFEAYSENFNACAEAYGIAYRVTPGYSASSTFASMAQLFGELGTCGASGYPMGEVRGIRTALTPRTEADARTACALLAATIGGSDPKLGLEDIDTLLAEALELAHITDGEARRATRNHRTYMLQYLPEEGEIELRVAISPAAEAQAGME